MTITLPVADIPLDFRQRLALPQNLPDDEVVNIEYWVSSDLEVERAPVEMSVAASFEVNSKEDFDKMINSLESDED